MEKDKLFTNKKRKSDKKKQNEKTKPSKEQIEEKNQKKNKAGWDNIINFTNELKNEKFEYYYKTQLSEYFKNEEEFQSFINKLKEKLPSVFRISRAHPFKKNFEKLITDENYINSLLGEKSNIVKVSKKILTNLPEWKDIVYNINIPRMELKKNSDLSKFHKFIQKSVDSGLISRQEAVSMIPPMLLNTKRGENIFDMCAAPGSKTAQFLESFYENYNFLNKKEYLNDTGFVLANDFNAKRAYMMVHQLKRLNTAGMVVICHAAQLFPNIFLNGDIMKRVQYDKILADVPCSSDAVMRKLPHKWKNWNSKESYSLHNLQLQILKRGIGLLKVGGEIVYSTCSLNPIENEAVVAQVMREFSQDDELEILDVNNIFKGSDIKRHNGLMKWKIMIEDKNDRNKLLVINDINDPLYNEFSDIISSSAFPPSEDESKKFKLFNCNRFFPHDSDTSGFFITVIKKLKPISSQDKSNKINEKIERKRAFEFVNEKFESEFKWIYDYYGIDNDFPGEQLITFSDLGKKINFISKGVCDLLKGDKRNQLDLQNAGVKLFKKNKQKGDSDDFCHYRICQDGLMYLIPYMHKRLFYVDKEVFVEILTKKELNYNDIKDENLKNSLKEAKAGCVIFVHVKKKPESIDKADNKYLVENFIDAICCFNANIKVTTMINKEHEHVFNLKYNIIQ